MNYKKYIGWYYNSESDRTASWSGVEFLYDFLIKNKGIGPKAIKKNISKVVQKICKTIQLELVPVVSCWL